MRVIFPPHTPVCIQRLHLGLCLLLTSDPRVLHAVLVMSHSDPFQHERMRRVPEYSASLKTWRISTPSNSSQAWAYLKPKFSGMNRSAKTQPQNRVGAANMAAVARMSNSRTVFRRGPMYLPWNKYSASRALVR